MKQQILKFLYSVGGFRPFHFLNRKNILILTYHRFSKYSDEFAVSAAEFEDHLRYLTAEHSVISLDEAVEHISENTTLPPNPVVITIDDGYSDAYHTAFPLLKKYSVPATLFVITDFLDGKCWLWTDLMRYALINSPVRDIDVDFGPHRRVTGCPDSRNERIRLAAELNNHLKELGDEDKSLRLKEIAESLGVATPAAPPAEFGPITWDQAREMDRCGVRIESHTVSHPILTNVGPDRLRSEVEDSKKILSDRLGRTPRHFCYPNGSFDDSVRNAVVQAGYLSAVTTNYGFADTESDLFGLKRIDGQPLIANFAQSASGFEGFRERVGI